MAVITGDIITGEVQPGPKSAGAIAARLDRLPLTRWHVKARVLVGTASFFDAFDALTIAQVLPVLVPLWKLSSSQIGLLISAGYLGQVIGALAFGLLAEKIGRLKAMSAAIAVFSIGSLLCASSENFWSLLVPRIFQGFGLGGEVPIAAAYISEIAKTKGRARFVLLYENIFSLGIVVAGILGSVLVPALGWQSMFLIGGVPIILAVVIPKTLPESPRWLASQGRLSEADTAVSHMEARIRKHVQGQLPPVGPIVEISRKPSTWADLFGGIYLRRSLVVWTIWFSSFLVYYSLTFWLPTLYRTVFQVPLDQSLRLGVLTSLAAVAGSLTAAFIADVLGRKKLFVLSLSGGALCLFGLWGFGATELAQVIYLGNAACFFVGMACIAVYVYTPELYPTRTRALGTSIGSAFLRLGTIVGPMIVGNFISYGIGFVCAVFGGIAACAAIIVAVFAVETTDQRLEDLSP